jgi:hypothetical protein
MAVKCSEFLHVCSHATSLPRWCSFFLSGVEELCGTGYQRRSFCYINAGEANYTAGSEALSPNHKRADITNTDGYKSLEPGRFSVQKARMNNQLRYFLTAA